MMGASSKARENAWVSIVAEVMISSQSGRRASNPLQVAEQKIDVQTALVRLVDDDGVVLAPEGSPCVSASSMPSV